MGKELIATSSKILRDHPRFSPQAGFSRTFQGDLVLTLPKTGTLTGKKAERNALPWPLNAHTHYINQCLRVTVSERVPV